MHKKIIEIISPLSLMIGVYLMGLYFTFIFPAFDVFIWMSAAMHTLGGIVTAFTIHQLFTIFSKKYSISIKPKFVYILFLVAMTVWVGVLWEIYEYIQDVLLSTVTQLGIADALLDLTMDTVGALLYSYFLLDIEPKNKS